MLDLILQNTLHYDQIDHAYDNNYEQNMKLQDCMIKVWSQANKNLGNGTTDILSKRTLFSFWFFWLLVIIHFSLNVLRIKGHPCFLS